MKISDITDDFLKSIDIHTLLPQQEPFVMVGRLVHFGMQSCTTETEIAESNIFVENGHFSPSGMIENIAQTCAARVGFYHKYIISDEFQPGYICSVKKYSITGKAPAGSRITTEVHILEDVFGMIKATATVSCRDEIIADTQIILVVKNSQ